MIQSHSYLAILLVLLGSIFGTGSRADNPPVPAGGTVPQALFNPAAKNALVGWRAEVESGRTVPFSFEIGQHPAQLNLVKATENTGDAGWQKIAVSYREKTEPITVELICEFPPTMDLVRMTLTLKTDGVLSGNVCHIDILDLATSRREASIHGETGGFSDPRGQFPPKGSNPWIRQVADTVPIEVSSGDDGRSSNDQLPIWLYAQADGGLWYGPEWSGCWDMTVHSAPGGTQIQVGLPTFDFTMKAGETLTLPTAAFGPYSGLPADGFNQLRKMIGGHYLRRVDGAKPKPFVYWEGYGAHPPYVDEAELYREVDRAAQIGCEVFCLDGGWNVPPEKSGTWYESVGYWENQARFPKGLRAFGDYVKSKGMKFGIWVEPRAVKGSSLHDKNPDLFYPGSEGLMRLDLPGGPEMFQGVFEQLIRDYGVNWVWLDYNVIPRTHWWNQMESPGQKGLMELGFYQGWYKAVDETLRKHPDLWIESCASGGRMIDLAQLRRTQSIWVADEAVVDDPSRNRRDGLNLFLPAVYIQNSLFIDPDFVSTAKPGVSLGSEDRFLTYFGGDLGFGQGLPFWKAEDIQAAAKYAAIYKQYRHYLEDDYYSLLPIPATRDAWDSSQYHDPRSDSGILLVFRLGESKQEVMSIHPRAVGNVEQYTWSVVAGGGTVQASDDGLTVRMPTSRATLIHYERKMPADSVKN